MWLVVGSVGCGTSGGGEPQNGDAMAVTHMGVLRAAYTLATGWNMATPMPADLDTAKILVLELGPDGKPTIHTLNMEFARSRKA